MRSEVFFHVDGVYAPALTIIAEGALTISAGYFLVCILNLVSILGRVWAIWIHLAWVSTTQGDFVEDLIVDARFWVDIAYVSL